VPEASNIDALIEGLRDVQKDARIEDLLQTALSEPIQTEQRLQQIEGALETFKEHGLFGEGDQRDIHIHRSLGRAYEQLSHLEKAFESYETALELAERFADTPTRAELLSWNGRVLSKWGRFEEAYQALQESADAFKGLDDIKGQASVALKIGVLLYRQSDYDRAQVALQDTLELAEQADLPATVAGANNNLAVLATIRGDLDGAIERYEACLVAYEHVGNQRGLASAYHNLGMAQADKKDYSTAMDCYEKGFEVARKVDHLVVMANIHLSMAEVLLEMGNSVMVPFCCSRALDIYKKTGNQSGEADTYRLLGNTFALRHDWESAQQLFEDSLELIQKVGNKLGAAEAQRDMGRMLIHWGRKNEAADALQSALDGFKEIGAEGDITQVRELIDGLQAAEDNQ
jgi:tetratricopeptide (TPR) repeat protein